MMLTHFNVGSSAAPLGSGLLSGMDAVQHLEILPLYEPRHQEHADGQEGEQQQGEDHLDVGPGVEAEEAQTAQLSNLQCGKYNM